MVVLIFAIINLPLTYEEIDKLLAEIEKENLDELDDETEIVDN